MAPNPATRTKVWRTLAWLPQRVHKEFHTHGGEPRFLMWISFLLAFTWARTWVLYFGKHSPNITFSEFQFGSRVAIAGYHPHHIASGVLLLAIVGWVLIHYQSKVLLRFMAVAYGAGLGLIVDEIGFIVEGIVPYRNDFAEVFVLVVAISAIMMSSIYFPTFWQALERRMKRLYARHVKRAPRAPVPVASVAPVAAPLDPPEKP